MELLTIITALLGGLIALGALAATSGADSRDSIGDDWARPAGI